MSNKFHSNLDFKSKRNSNKLKNGPPFSLNKKLWTGWYLLLASNEFLDFFLFKRFSCNVFKYCLQSLSMTVSFHFLILCFLLKMKTTPYPRPIIIKTKPTV